MQNAVWKYSRFPQFILHWHKVNFGPCCPCSRDSNRVSRHIHYVVGLQWHILVFCWCKLTERIFFFFFTKCLNANPPVFLALNCQELTDNAGDLQWLWVYEHISYILWLWFIDWNNGPVLLLLLCKWNWDVLAETFLSHSDCLRRFWPVSVETGFTVPPVWYPPRCLC